MDECSAKPNTILLTTELPTPLKKRRLSPLDACMSESSTPYGSPCATPTRTDQLETPATPILMATPPRPQMEEPSTEPLPSTPTQTLNAPLEVRLTVRKPHLITQCKEMEVLILFLVPQSDSSLESSPEVSRKSSLQEVSEEHGSNSNF